MSDKQGRENSRWASDIDGLAARVPGFDPGKYHDQQAWQALCEARARWPGLTRLMASGEAGGGPRTVLAVPAPILATADLDPKQS